MQYKKIAVDSLGGYMNEIAKLAENAKDPMYPPILWFRGQCNTQHSLVPSLFRKKVHIPNGTEGGSYSKLHYAEDIRTQHYIAKNYHLLSKEPSSRVEWLEVMQHHRINTRVLDWSESSLHSLLFAIEPFLKNRQYNEAKRKTSTPCVWVLNPQKLNKHILEGIKNNAKLQKELLKDMDTTNQEEQEMLRHIAKYGDIGFTETEETAHIDYIFNLSSINDEILRDRVRLKRLLCSGSIINPYYYLLFRIYSDGYTLENRSLPPLCVVHPYHSERIRAQRGVFTVFPFYAEQPEDKFLRELNVNPDGMEYNHIVKPCLCQIRINKPQKVALELMKNGMNGSWLYPEMPVVSSEIEEHRIF